MLDPSGDPLPRPVLQADPAVPSPARVLGRRLGVSILDHREARLYARRLAEASERVVYLPYGHSVEGRELFILVIGEPARVADPGAARRVNESLAQPGAEGDALARAGDTPVTVWLAGSVHGDEHSSTEALLLAAYYLAADTSSTTTQLLRDVLVIIEPLQNPDGRSRFVAHQAKSWFGAPNPDPQAWEHAQDWPRGRGNHFLFDLNRDWFFQTQPETRARIQAFLAWRPQVFVDLHEMSGDSSYFFAPPAEPVHAFVPASTRKWWSVFGEALSRAFDKRGAPFYRRETFDLFYPGYGDSWPTFQGAIGMTFEQASVRGLVRRRDDGELIPLGLAIGNHLTAALTTVQCAAEHRPDLLESYRAQRAKPVSGPSVPRTVYLPADRYPTTVDRLEKRLRRQGVAVGRLAKPMRLDRARGYRGEPIAAVDLAPGTLVVRTDGAGGRLAAALFALDARLPEAFLAEERRRLLAGQRGRIYDVTAWSLPLVYDLPAWASNRSAPAELVVPAPASPAAPPVAAAAYLLPPARLAWARAVAALLERGIRVRVSADTMTRDGRDLAAGTAVVLVPANGEHVHEAVRESGAQAAVSWLAVDSYASSDGIDLGSDRIFPLKRVRVGVAVGHPIRPTSFGSVADVLANAVELPFTALPLAGLAAADLSRFDVLVLPDADPRAYAEALSPRAVRSIKAFVETGGVVVALSGAAAFCGRKGVELTRTGALPARGENGEKTVPDAATGPNDSERHQEEPEPEGRLAPLHTVPGAILRVSLSPEDLLAFGQGEEIPVPVSGKLVLKAPEEFKSVRVVGRFAARERLRLAGVVWREAEERLAGSPWLVREKRGRGTVVLFATDPLFRGAWDGLRALFLNAVLLEPSRR